MIRDLSTPIRPGMPVWPGDPQVEVRAGVDEQSGASVSRLSMGSHTGTHVDPPAHYLRDGATADQLALQILLGVAWVAYLPGKEQITASRLETAGVPRGTRRLLLRTGNSEPSAPTTFDPDFVSLAGDAADWLLAHGIALVGIDGPSIDALDAAGMPVHRRLLARGVIIIEGLSMTGVTPGRYWLICLPLRITGGDGAPARVVLLDLERNARDGYDETEGAFVPNAKS